MSFRLRFRIATHSPIEGMAAEHPLVLELDSLKVALEKYQAGVHLHTTSIL